MTRVRRLLLAALACAVLPACAPEPAEPPAAEPPAAPAASPGRPTSVIGAAREGTARAEADLQARVDGMDAQVRAAAGGDTFLR